MIPITLLIGLSLHSVFEGLTLGVSSNHSFVQSLLVEISIYKLIVSFSLVRLLSQQGISLAGYLTGQSDLKRAVLVLCVFSVSTPLGIGIGWAFLSSTPVLVSVILSVITGGILLYIGSSSIVASEFPKESSSKAGRLVCFSVGVAVVAIGIAISTFT